MAVTLALAIALAACSSSQTVSLPLPDQVDAAIGGDVQAQLQTAVERAAASGASGDRRRARSVGRCLGRGRRHGRSGGAAVNDAMTFHAGVTRSMTCDVLYGLVHDGVVSLDDPVGKYVTGLGSGCSGRPDARSALRLDIGIGRTIRASTRACVPPLPRLDPRS
jgi:D-alanyl-D-alanine carboxypeptidase